MTHVHTHVFNNRNQGRREKGLLAFRAVRGQGIQPLSGKDVKRLKKTNNQKVEKSFQGFSVLTCGSLPLWAASTLVPTQSVDE